MIRIRELSVAVALAGLLTSSAALGQRLYNSAVASSHPLASAAGYRILGQGGNAFDAAVAVAAALAVVEPYASGLGGGGFWLLHRASDGFEVLVDGRETAPGGATVDMYQGKAGPPAPQASLQGPRAAGIPGTPAALAWVARRYGKLPLARTLAPAIGYAEQGFSVDSRYLAAARARASLLAQYSASAGIFLQHGAVPAAGFVLRQPELADTLRRLARHGRDGFYRGPVADKLVRAAQNNGGIWQRRDLERYRVMERTPVVFAHRGARIVSAPLPSSGGLVLAQALNILEALPSQGGEEAERAHYRVEALRRAYQDRARYLGDPDFVNVPVARLLSKSYARERAADIIPGRATPSDTLEGPVRPEGGNTTHFSIVDRDGNRVAVTLSINTPFGSGFVAEGTGVLLNNEMDDFAVAPGVPNAYGLVGAAANAIAPGKRPLSSMSPTFVEDHRGILVLGTPGGSRIISMVYLGILEYLSQAVPDPLGVVTASRFHHQFLPDRVEVEPGAFSSEWVAALAAKGHRVEIGPRRWGNMQAVWVDKASRTALSAGDPRGAVGY